jgi:hypothetical protein
MSQMKSAVQYPSTSVRATSTADIAREVSEEVLSRMREEPAEVDNKLEPKLRDWINKAIDKKMGDVTKANQNFLDKVGLQVQKMQDMLDRRLPPYVSDDRPPQLSAKQLMAAMSEFAELQRLFSASIPGVFAGSSSQSSGLGSSAAGYTHQHPAIPSFATTTPHGMAQHSSYATPNAYYSKPQHLPPPFPMHTQHAAHMAHGTSPHGNIVRHYDEFYPGPTEEYMASAETGRFQHRAASGGPGQVSRSRDSEATTTTTSAAAPGQDPHVSNVALVTAPTSGDSAPDGAAAQPGTSPAQGGTFNVDNMTHEQTQQLLRQLLKRSSK